MAQVKVLVYSGEGVERRGFKHLWAALEDSLSSAYSLHSVNHSYLLEEAWEAETALLVLPGGRDIPYHTHLKGAGNARIASFVDKGGCYLGICAGGYYGAAYVEFEKGRELEVCAPRELAFYPGKAIGPAYGLGLFSYDNEKGVRKAHLRWEGGESYLYFNGGCFFEELEASPSTEVLARYHDLPGTPAAVVKCNLGEGRAILCGAHPEYKLSSPLEPQRKIFWNYLLSSFGIGLG